MSQTRLLTLIGPAALLATCVCIGEAAHAIGSGIRSSKTGLLRRLPNDVAVSVFESGDSDSTIPTGRARCYDGALSARDMCGRMRGGSSAEGPGPTDYLSTLQDQSQPWWVDSKKARKRNQAGAGRGGISTGAKKKKSAAPSAVSSATKRATSSWARSARAGGGGRASGVDSLSPAGWAALLALPVSVFASKYNDEKGGRTAAPSAARAKSVAKKPAKLLPTVVQKPEKRTPAAKAKMTPKPKPAPVMKGGNNGRSGGGSRGVFATLVPDNPYLRALCVIALAVLGSGGLQALTSNDLLRAAWPITFVDPWQVLTALAWAVNMRATFIGGRLDGVSQAKNSDPRPVRFFSPAGWAFAIWGPIFFGEMIFVILQLLPLPSIRETWWLSAISPWFAGAMLYQTLWCLSFRPWARDSGLLWLPAVLLGGVAVALGGVNGILREAWFSSDMKIPQYLAAHVPLSLHFGWISCAALVNLNGYLASISKLSDGFKLGASLCSVVASVILGVGITILREDPLYAAVVAWALWAVGSPAGWDDLRGRVDPGMIRTQQAATKAGAAIAATAAGALVGLALKDAIMGTGEYDEDY